MVQDSTRNFLQKPSSAPFENPFSTPREKQEPVIRDSTKIKYIEKFVPKAVKKKDSQKDKKDKKKKSDASASQLKKTSDTKKKSADLQKIKGQKKPDADSVFRFKDIEETVPPVVKNTDVLPIMSDTAIAKEQETLQLFTGHELQQVNKHPQPINRESSDWIFITLLFACSAFVWVKVFYNKIFIQISQAFLNNRITNQIVRDENILVQKASVLLTIIFNLVVSLFLYQISVLYDWEHDYVGTGFNRFLIFALGISLIYTVKFLILKIVGHIFLLDKAIAIYIFNIFLINNILGIALLPVLTFISFSNIYREYGIYLAFILICGAFLYRIVRGCLVGLSYSRFSILYLFLYLCALEIAPLLILYKILVIRELS